MFPDSAVGLYGPQHDGIQHNDSEFNTEQKDTLSIIVRSNIVVKIC